MHPARFLMLGAVFRIYPGHHQVALTTGPTGQLRQTNKDAFFPPSYESRTAGSTCLHLNLALRVVILAPAPGLTHSLAPSSERMFSGGLMETHSFLNRAEIHFGPCGGKIPPRAEFFLLMQRSHTCSLWDHISPELRNTHTKININIDANDSFKT